VDACIDASVTLCWRVQLYTAAGAYDGAAKLYENLIMDCPAYERLPRVYMNLASLYRRLKDFDRAFHYFL
jgi:hypothetical protein